MEQMSKTEAFKKKKEVEKNVKTTPTKWDSISHMPSKGY